MKDKQTKFFKYLYFIYIFLLVIYCGIVLLLLGVTFDIDFLDDVKNMIVNHYGETLTPIMIISTICLFIPFAIMTYINCSIISKKIDSIFSEKLTDIDEKINDIKNKASNNSKDIQLIENKKLEIKKEHLRIMQKQIELQKYSTRVYKDDINLNRKLNIIANKSKICTCKEFKNTIKEYNESLEHLISKLD